MTDTLRDALAAAPDGALGRIAFSWVEIEELAPHDGGAPTQADLDDHLTFLKMLRDLAASAHGRVTTCTGTSRCDTPVRDHGSHRYGHSASTPLSNPPGISATHASFRRELGVTSQSRAARRARADAWRGPDS